MAFDQKTLDAVFRKTDGRCHICRGNLARGNYGAKKIRGAGAWEVEHSVPRAHGGTNHLNNLYPAHVTCNRSKGATSTREARKKYGYMAAPLPRRKKSANALVGGACGLVAGHVVLRSLGPAGIAAAALAGIIIGYKREPK